MLNCASKGDFNGARKELLVLLLSYGMSGEDVLIQAHREALRMDLPDAKKLDVIKEIGECNFRIVQGANERIQLEAMLANMASRA